MAASPLDASIGISQALAVPGNPSVRTHAAQDGKVWYCAKDLAAALGQRWVNAKQNLGHLPERDRLQFHFTTKGGRQKAWFVSAQAARHLLGKGVIQSCKNAGSPPGVFAEKRADIIPSPPKGPPKRPPVRPTPEQIIVLAKRLTPAQVAILQNRYEWRLAEAASGQRQPPALHRVLSPNPPPLLHAMLLLDDIANSDLRKLSPVLAEKYRQAAV